MVPALKRAFVLHVGEIVIRFEFCDTRDPLRAVWQKREDPERGDDNRPDAGSFTGSRARRRRYPVQHDQLCATGRGHDAWQVPRIREEREYLLDRKRNPLFELEMFHHESQALMVSRTSQRHLT